ncbi:MAG: hypothetical protein JWO20_1737 [Candidatus Angelobacter sp.]|jgi:hypothetical protein|nr:hypothetical protein [Candidatus Angelobacter sp.]
MRNTAHKVLLALLCGLLVSGTAGIVHLAIIPIDRIMLVHELIGDLGAGLVAVLVCLTIHLKYEGLYYRFAMERAAIVAEVNHHVRNAVFPLSMAIQSGGNADAIKMADEAVERINITLRDALTDALSRNVQYATSTKASSRDVVEK